MHHPSNRLQVGVVVLAVGWLAGTSEAAAVPVGTYGLAPESSFEEGCFAPCECPLLLARDVSGEFALTPKGTEGDVSVFEVADLLWKVSMPDGVMEIKGSGTFRVGGTEPLQRLELDLAVGTRPVERFDSGWVPWIPTTPEINLLLSMHELRCFDIVLRVKAMPLESSPIKNDPRKQLRPLPWPLPKGSRRAETTWGRLKALEPRQPDER